MTIEVALGRQLLDQFVNALIAGDNNQCTQITDRVIADGTPIFQVYEQLFQPALYRVGQLWAENRISVATEHQATAITEGLMNHLYPQLINPERLGRRVLLATVESELHQVGIKMAADVFESLGWDSIISEPGISTEALLTRIASTKPDMVGISLCVSSHLSNLQNMLTQIRKVHPHLPILIGGQGLLYGAKAVADHYFGVTYLDDLKHLHRLLADSEDKPN
jgi:methanogenic corrinoid protein MtbC1